MAAKQFAWQNMFHGQKYTLQDQQPVFDAVWMILSLILLMTYNMEGRGYSLRRVIFIGNKDSFEPHLEPVEK